MSDKTQEQITKWRVAHPGIEIREEALRTMAPFPSLHANDFIVYAEQLDLPSEVKRFVRDISREMVWTYDNWAHAQRDADRTALFTDILNQTNITGSEGGASNNDWAMVRKFLKDYAAANNIVLTEEDDTPWMDAFSNAAPATAGVTIPPESEGDA